MGQPLGATDNTVVVPIGTTVVGLWLTGLPAVGVFLVGIPSVRS